MKYTLIGVLSLLSVLSANAQTPKNYVEDTRNIAKGNIVMTELVKKGEDTTVVNYFDGIFPTTDTEGWTRKMVIKGEKQGKDYIVTSDVFTKDAAANSADEKRYSNSVRTYKYKDAKKYTTVTTFFIEDGLLETKISDHKQSRYECHNVEGTKVADASCFVTMDKENAAKNRELVTCALRDEAIAIYNEYKYTIPLVIMTQVSIDPKTGEKKLVFDDLTKFSISKEDNDVIAKRLTAVVDALSNDEFTFPKDRNGNVYPLNFSVPLKFRLK